MSRGSASAPIGTHGRLYARFDLGPDGRPKFTAGDDGQKHYWIELVYQPESGPRVESVTYVLDEETYHDPIRVADARSGYASRTSSYGDYLLVAKLETPTGFDVRSAKLSDLLREGHRADLATNPAVAQAIADLEAN